MKGVKNKTQKELLNLLVKEVSSLKKEMEKIKKKKILTTEDSLMKLWDNKYDARWDNY